MNNYLSYKKIALMVLISILLLAACRPEIEATTPPPAAVPPTESEPTAITSLPEAMPSPTPESAIEPPTQPLNVVGTISKGILLDPASVTDEDSLVVSSYIYEGLVRLDDGGQPTPALATSWIISDDGLDYIFSLRPQVTFHDGTPLVADIVLDNFNRWFDPDHPLHGDDPAYDGWEQYFLGFKGETDADDQPISFFDGIEKVDNLTVLIHLNRQEPGLLTILSQPYFAMINTMGLEVEGEGYGTRDGSAIGTGPYILGDWTDDILLLQPNPDYWDTPPGTEISFTWKD